MDGEPVYITAPVEAGQTYDFYVDLTAPSGVYGVLQGRWQMQAPGGIFFGQTVWVMVDVVAPTPGPTATVTATATTAPTTQPTAAPTTQPTAGVTATSAPPPTAIPTPTPTPDPLFGLTFGFYAIRDQATIPNVPLTVTFGNLEGTGGLSGFDGCNTFGGTYSVTPTSASQGGLTISLGLGTTAACEPEIMDQAQAFREALSLTTAYVYPPRSLLLELLDQSGTETLSGELQ
jgi:heat shock protein HslJ